MEVSQEFRNHILEEVKKLNLPKWLEHHTGAKFVSMPVFIDGVIDYIKWDVKKQRYTEIEVTMAKSGVATADFLPVNTVYADEIERVIISLDEN